MRLLFAKEESKKDREKDLKNLYPLLVCEAEYRSQTGLLPFRNDSRAIIKVRFILLDMDIKESGPLATFVGQRGVETGQGGRLEKFAPFSCMRG